MADVAKTSKMNNAARGFSKFFRDVRYELKKVIWPTRQQLINNTGTVLLTCLIIGAVIWIADLGMQELLKLFLVK
jgi:preprotein translocase subunit SecE